MMMDDLSSIKGWKDAAKSGDVGDVLMSAVRL